jgi:hypothetical protein
LHFEKHFIRMGYRPWRAQVNVPKCVGSVRPAGGDPNVWGLAFKAGSRQGDEIN